MNVSNVVRVVTVAVLMFFSCQLFAQLKQMDVKKVPQRNLRWGIQPGIEGEYARIFVQSSLNKPISFLNSNGNILDQKFDGVEKKYVLTVLLEKSKIPVVIEGFVNGLLEITAKPQNREILVYQVSEKKADVIEKEATMGKVSIVSVPPAASISISTEPGSLFTSPYILERTGGYYRITVSKDEYTSSDTTIEILPSTQTEKKLAEVTVCLSAKFGLLTLECKEPDAAFTIDGMVLSTTQGKIKLPVGTHSVQVLDKYFEKYSRDITLRPESPPAESRLTVDLRRKSGTISMTSSPSGASLFVDGNRKGTTPYNQSIPAGMHTIRMEMNGFLTEEFEVEVLSGTVTRSINLSKNGLLRVEGTQGARVNLIGPDGKNERNLGTLPISKELNLTPGKYTLTASLNGYDDMETSFTLENEKLVKTLDLAETKGRAFRFLGWPTKRGSEINSGVSASFVYNNYSFSTKLLSALVHSKYTQTNSGNTMGGAIIYYANPLHIGAQMCSGTIASVNKGLSTDATSDVKYNLYTGKIGWTWMAFWERIFVESDVFGEYLHATSTGGNNNEIIVKQTQFGGSLGLRIKERMFNLTVGKKFYLIDPVYENTFYAEVGILLFQ